MLRPNNNQLYSYYVLLLIPTEYLQYYLQYNGQIQSHRHQHSRWEVSENPQNGHT